MYLIYSLLYFLAFLALLPRELSRRPSKLRKRWLKERSGFLKPIEKKSDLKTIWIHAVSVGEAIAARPVIKKLREKGNIKIVVTTVTDTGQKIMRAFLRDNEELFYAPFDLPVPLRRFFKNINPSLLIIMETEIWPNILRYARKRKIPVCLVNGRISASSYRGYKKISFFIKRVLKNFDLLMMQTEEDAKRILDIGADREKTVVLGNLKFDVPVPAGIPEWMRKIKRPVIIAGSTHEGEDEIVLDAFKEVGKSFSEAVLIIAPRHPERFSSVAELVESRGYRMGLRSREEFEDIDVLVLDTIGELSSVYGGADVAVVCGSFIERGGHNLFEPAAWGVPVVCGPHMENFPLAEEFFRSGAAISVSADRLSSVIIKILSDKKYAGSIGNKAKEIYEGYKGVADRTIKNIEKLLYP
jgi:3-deoxy-D-manno-octulosonic-acid transferase